MKDRSSLELWSWIAGIAAALIAAITLGVQVSQLRGVPTPTPEPATSAVAEEMGGPQGGWDQRQAVSAALRRLQVTDWLSVDGFCADVCIPTHEFVASHHLILSDRQVYLLLFSSVNDDFCHACAPLVSLFEFEYSGKAWSLAVEDIAFASWGTWGSLPPDQVTVHRLGGNHFGLLLEASDMHQGYEESRAEMYTRLGDALTKVLRVTTGKSNESAGGLDDSTLVSSWTASIEILPTDTEMYDIQLMAEGVEEGKSFRTMRNYKFSGSEYVEDEVRPLVPDTASSFVGR